MSPLAVTRFLNMTSTKNAYLRHQLEHKIQHSFKINVLTVHFLTGERTKINWNGWSALSEKTYNN